MQRTAKTPTVFVIENDGTARTALCELPGSTPFHVEHFARGSDFLAAYPAERPGCVVSDAHMPDLSGLELLQWLTSEGLGWPVVLFSDGRDVELAVEALRRGAIDFLVKPLRPQVLLDRVRAALAQDAATRRFRALRQTIAACAERLAPRERAVLNYVAAGLTSQAIAARLGVSRKVIEACRGRAMQKLGAGSVAQVVRMLIVLTGDVEGSLAEWAAAHRPSSTEEQARTSRSLTSAALDFSPPADGCFEHRAVGELNL